MILDDDIQIYREVLLNKRKRFPQKFWSEQDGKLKSQKITKYLLEVILEWSHEDIAENLKITTFKKHKLGGMIVVLYGDSYSELIHSIYPGVFKPWSFKSTENGYWNIETAKNATKWLLEEELMWSDDEIKENLTGEVFKQHGLGGMLSIIFKNSSYNAVENCYPGRFKPWELKMCPMNTWTKESAKEATLWMLDKLKWDDEDIKTKLTGQVFKNHSLGGMLSSMFKDSVYLALDNVFPGKYNAWELKNRPANTWNKESAKTATLHLFQEKLKWDFDTIKASATGQTFKKNGLGGMLYVVFKNKPYEAISNAYPNMFMPWELKCTPKGFWQKDENIKKCVLHILQKHFNRIPSKEEAMKYLNKDVLLENGAISILSKSKFTGFKSLIDFCYADIEI